MEKYYENKRLLVASVLALGAVGTLGYLLYTSKSQPPTSKPTSSPTASGADTTSSKSKKNKKKKKAAKKSEKSHGFETTRATPESAPYPLIDDFSKVEAMDEASKKELGEELKLAGNDAFKVKNFNLALDLYTQAIKCHEDPVFYSNRSAVWGSLQDYENVVKDTTQALKLRPDYIKCYTRRAVAYEQLQNFREAVMDYTAACILQNFEDDSVGNSVDRTLKALAEQRVSKEGATVNTEFPSANFIKAYLESYHKKTLPNEIETAEEGTSNYELKIAFDCMEKGNQESYKQCYEHLQRAVKLPFTSKESEALAFEYLATFEFLLNDNAKSLKSINHSLSVMQTVPAYLKRSAIHIEGGRLTESEADFESAKQLDSENADLYYQLAQVAFLQADWQTAQKHYKKCVDLDDTFVLAHIQLAVTEYRQERVEESKKRFKQLIEKWPTNAFVYNYYGEILLDQKDINGAIAMFDKSFELEKQNQIADVNVLPLVNKSLALAQRAQTPSDIEKAIQVCKQASTLDPLSDVAVGTLAQFALQQGRTTEALELFERNAKLARSPAEQVQAYTFAEAARTQYRIALERPAVREHLKLLSSAQ